MGGTFLASGSQFLTSKGTCFLHVPQCAEHPGTGRRALGGLCTVPSMALRTEETAGTVHSAGQRLQCPHPKCRHCLPPTLAQAHSLWTINKHLWDCGFERCWVDQEWVCAIRASRRWAVRASFLLGPGEGASRNREGHPRPRERHVPSERGAGSTMHTNPAPQEASGGTHCQPCPLAQVWQTRRHTGLVPYHACSKDCFQSKSPRLPCPRPCDLECSHLARRVQSGVTLPESIPAWLLVCCVTLAGYRASLCLPCRAWMITT